MSPVIVDPSTPTPDPPDTATSPDGLLTATYLPGSASSEYCRPYCQRYPCDSDAAESRPGGVYLVADFTDGVNITPDPQFVDDAYLNSLRFPQWSHRDGADADLPVGTIRVTGYTDGDEDAELSGMRMWIVGEEPWSKSDSPPGNPDHYYPIVGGSVWEISYQVQPAETHEFRVQVAWLLADGSTQNPVYGGGRTITANTWGTITDNFTAPTNAIGLAWAINPTSSPDSTSFSILLRNPVTRRPDLIPEAKRIDYVRFVRVDQDGNEYPVRGGDPATAVGGIAYAFDIEAPLGETSQWYAVPIYNDGTEGPPTQSVALSPPWPAGDLDCWLKPIGNPNASTMAQIIQPLPNFTRASRNQLSPVQGARLQAGGWDLHLAAEGTFTFWTPDCITRKQIIAALTSGPLLLQCRPDYQVDDVYVLAGDITEVPLETTWHDPGRTWSVPFTPIPRPATADTPAVVLGRSYADTHEVAGTYESRYDIWPTYADVSRPIGVPAPLPAGALPGSAVRGGSYA